MVPTRAENRTKQMNVYGYGTSNYRRKKQLWR